VNNRENIKQKKRERPALDAIVKAVATGIFVASLFFNLLFIIIIAVMASTIGAVQGPDAQKAGYRKVYIDSGGEQAKTASGEVAVVRLEGMITEYDQSDLFGYTENPVNAVTNRLRLIRNDSSVRGVLLVINSPGGSVSASDTLYHALLDFKAETGLPVVVLFKQVGASGAYYVASAADYIVAHPTAITGSIGVILYSFNIKGLMDKYGVKYIAIRTGEYKDLVSPFREVEEKELQWLQKIVDQMLELFIGAVAEGRKNLTPEQVRKLADGRIYLASDALKLGLIDATGYFNDAVRVLSERSGVLQPRLAEYQRERGLLDLFRLGALRLKPRSIMPSFPGEGELNPFDLYFLWEGAFSLH